MPQKQLDLSRRKLLAGLGTAGVAAAGAGIGTTAYLSDTESFDGNMITAGELDLKVDWEEHYSDWSDDEAAAVDGDVVMTDGDPENVPEGYVGLPDPTMPLIAIPDGSLDSFMDATSIEAFPDPDDDGVQGGPEFEYDACEMGADMPDDLDPTGDGLRTLNQDTYDMENEAVHPLIHLGDVKPGDFGELTLSFHLCDNPGYVWLNGALNEELTSENGVTEPEAADPDEEEGVVELLDAIQTTWWYDSDGDNVLDGDEGEPPCVQIVLDASASMTNTDGDGVTRNQEAINGAQQLAEEIIDAGGSVGVTFFSADDYDNSAQLQQTVGGGDATDVSATQSTIANLPADGDATAIGEGILVADEDLSNCDEGDRTIQVVITDGQNNAGTNPSDAADDVTGGDADDYTGEIFAIGTGGATEASLGNFARPNDDAHVEFADDLAAVIANLATVILPEEVIFRGSLRDSLNALESGNGIPLDGNLASDFDEIEDDPDSESRDCFQNSVDHYIGFAWYLPVDHANEIQSDIAAFDLGFYTEQCRHNDGAGMPPEDANST